jgi:autotransporter-associated beta strand protein
LLLIASAGFGTLAMLLAPTAHATDGTWQGPGNDWTTGTNWSSSPAVPDNTATFTINGAPTSVTFATATNTTINTILFTAGAPAYSFTLPLSGTLSITGTGIINQSSNAPTFLVPSVSNLKFMNSSTAGNAIITNSGTNAATTFLSSSTAENATTTNSARGFTNFNDNSTAGNATITSNINGFVAFLDSSTAGNATITNNLGGFATFSNTSTAGNATITSNFGGATQFANSSTAGNATLIANSGGTTQFFQLSSAGNATVVTNNGASTQFFQFSTGGNATFITQIGGAFDMSGLLSTGMTAGSIEGAGTYFLGAKTLTVGGNNLSTTVSGAISDGGAAGGAGGSLVKVGAGTLTLAGANSYTGATVVAGGTLLLTGDISPSSGVVVGPNATLAGTGTAPGVLVGGGTLMPGLPNAVGTLNVAGSLVFTSCRGQPRIHVRRHLPHQHQCDHCEPDQCHRDRGTRWSDRPGCGRQEHHQAPGLHLVDGHGRDHRDLQPRRSRREKQGGAVLQREQCVPVPTASSAT